MTEQFKKYLEKYITLLVNGKSDFFIAIVDVERELALDFLKSRSDCLPYKTVWFERRDYAAAVRLRNDPCIRQIVLLSNDTVKMIDSLKDFVEYPILPERQEDLWCCLETAFRVRFDSECKKILGTVLEQKQIPLEDLLTYIDDCIHNNECSAEKMLNNLFQFEIWSMKNINEEKPLTKGQIKRMIRNSNPIQLEKRLIGGLTGESPDFSEKEQKSILRCLSQNNLKDLFRLIPYDERVEQLFKSSSRNPENAAGEKPEARQYENSYVYAISESLEEDIRKIEDELLAEMKDSPEENHPLEKSMQSFAYPEIHLLEEQFLEMEEDVKNLNFTERKRVLVETNLAHIKESFLKAVKSGKQYTPVYLEHYVESQKELIKSYLGFLALCLSDDGIARRCEGAGFLNRVQNLFCEEKNGILKMPFYHPIMGFYYWKLQKSFEEYRNIQAVHQDDFSQEIILALIQKEQMDFPVPYMLWDKQLYQLDFTSIQEWGGEAAFGRVTDYAVGSWSNIRLLNEDLVDYITRQRFLSEIRVTIVDLNDVSEIMFLLERLQKLPESEECMVHKVILNIISEKEEALKQKLQESMEMDIENPQVMFRFTKELYRKDAEYDLKGIIEDSDLVFLADSHFLYQKPRLVAWEQDENWFRIAMEQMGTEKIAEMFLDQRQDSLEVLWDSIHYIELEEETKLTCWRTRELKQTIFSTFRKAIDTNPKLTIVLMSSNQQIMQHIYHLPGFQARKSIVPGQEMLLLNFHKGSRRKVLERSENARVQIFLKPFLEEFLGNSEMFDSEHEKDWEYEIPSLVFDYKEHKVKCLVQIEREDHFSECMDRVEYYRGLIKKMIEFTCESRKFKEKMVTMLYEEATSYGAVLLVDHIERVGLEQIEQEQIDPEYIEKRSGRKPRRIKDIVDVLAIQNMLSFIRRRMGNIDEYTMRHFVELYTKNMLEGCLEAEETMQILESETRQKMQILYQMMENANE